jgi:hypothetical protein
MYNPRQLLALKSGSHQVLSIGYLLPVTPLLFSLQHRLYIHHYQPWFPSSIIDWDFYDSNSLLGIFFTFDELDPRTKVTSDCRETPGVVREIDCQGFVDHGVVLADPKILLNLPWVV